MTDKAQKQLKEQKIDQVKPQPTPQPVAQMAPQALPPQPLIQRAMLDPGRLQPGDVQRLQGMVGNNTVSQLLAVVRPAQAEVQRQRGHQAKTGGGPPDPVAADEREGFRRQLAQVG